MFQMLDVISLETPQRKWASSRRQGRTSWSFLELRQVLSTYDGSAGTRSGGLRKGQSRSQTALERERHHERLPSNSHGDWPFLRPPKRVPEVPVVS